MKEIVCALVFCLGCASYEVEYIPPYPEAATILVKSHMYGRGCIAMDLALDGTVSIVVAQDGSTDWIIGRALGWIAELAAPIFGGRNDPDQMKGTSTVQGCDGLFETGIDPANGRVWTEVWNVS